VWRPVTLNGGQYERGSIVAKNLPSVFVVEDEKTIAETLVTILRRSGFAAKSFTDPREALSAAREETPDLLLSNVMMPELSGIDLAIAIRQACPECKVCCSPVTRRRQTFFPTLVSKVTTFICLLSPSIRLIYFVAFANKTWLGR
jgi:CheY-like chemotaxis protein